MTNKQRCWGTGDPLMERYHDKEWGVPLKNDDQYFERLTLETFQACLSWRTILLKRQAFRRTFENFSISKVANYTERDVKRLLNDKSIIRNRLKINSAIYNANVFIQLKKELGSFKKWLDTIDVKDRNVHGVFKEKFKFMGPEIVRSFLMSVGKIQECHEKGCWKFKE